MLNYFVLYIVIYMYSKIDLVLIMKISAIFYCCVAAQEECNPFLAYYRSHSPPAKVDSD